MRVRISRSTVLIAIVVAILLVTAPPHIVTFLRTGDPYLFTRRFFEDMLARLSGPGRLRFLIQPFIAILLGLRDGRTDARSQSPPFLMALGDSAHNRQAIKTAIRSISDVIAIAIILDVISQFLIFRNIHPGAAILLGPVLIALPYALSRALANRIMSLRLLNRR